MVHKDHNSIIQTSSIENTGNRHQKANNYGTDFNTQNNPVYTERQREKKTNNKEHQQSGS